MIRLSLLAASLAAVAAWGRSDKSDRSDLSDGSRKPPIGWCCFFPFVDVGMELLPKSHASILSVCSGGWGMGHVEDRLDFGPFDRQLAYAEKHDLRLAVIQEINPFYAPAWLRDRVKAAGQSARNAQGVELTTPSISSQLFRSEQERLLTAFVKHVRETDKNRRVAFYHPGAEWWFPLNERYHPDDVAAFRKWLGKRYGGIEALNRAWQSAYRAFGDVPAPRIDMMGGAKGQTGLAQVVDVGHGMQHTSWSTPAAIDPAAKPGADTYPAAVPGRRYRMSAWALIERLGGPGVFLETAWVGPNGGPPVAIDQSPAVRGPVGKWQRLSATFKAPPGAGRAWLLLKFMGTGAARFDDVSFVEESGGPDAAPNPGIEAGGERPAAWLFQCWTGGAHVKSEVLRAGGRGGGRCLRVEVPEDGGVRPSYGNGTAAVHDWCTYWFDAGAEYINAMSSIMKRLDRSRPTVTYLTMSWAAPSEWDETQRSAIAPDVVGMRGKHVDAFGMQVCSADKDPFRVTACIDLMRKYRKPLWAVDLVDFTSGVHIGPEAMARITQATIQHGAAGIIYCAWHIPSVLDYSFHPHYTSEDQARMVDGAVKGVRAMEGMRPWPHGALIMPMLPATPDDPDGVRNDWRSFVGWYKLLERLHLTVDIVTLRELDGGAGLAEYPWVLVPDCRDISDAALRGLRAYAAKGGKLIAAGRFAERDDHGQPRAANIQVRRAPDLGRLYAGDPIRDTHAGNTPPLFLWNTAGLSRARVLERARTLLSPRIAVMPAPSDVPNGVSVVRWSGIGRRAWYLVNHGPRAARGVRLRLRASGGDRVTVLTDMAPARGRALKAGGRTTVAVPDFSTSCIIRTDTPRRKADR